MIIVDVNIPIHAINRESRYHDLVRSWWDEQLSETAANLTTDAHLAALVIQHGGVLYTTDTDFARFPELRWCNLLSEK